MSTIADVTAAEERMNRAKEALLQYVEGRSGKAIDRDDYRRLVSRLKTANGRFMRSLAGLGE